MKIRKVTIEDAAKMSAFLKQLTAVGKGTLPDDEDFVRESYIGHADNIQCVVAEDVDGSIVGLQVLKLAAVGNDYGVEPGWGMVGTHVSPTAARKGVGKALFEATKKAAIASDIDNIDATIGKTTPEGLGYYEAIGFRTYKEEDHRLCKCYKVIR